MQGAGVNVQFSRDAGARRARYMTTLCSAGLTGSAPPCAKKTGGVPAGMRRLAASSSLSRLRVARIDRNGEVRPATHLVDVVDRLIGPLVEARRGRDREMAPRREADDARQPAENAVDEGAWDSPFTKVTRTETESLLLRRLAGLQQPGPGRLPVSLGVEAREACWDRINGYLSCLRSIPSRSFNRDSPFK